MEFSALSILRRPGTSPRGFSTIGLEVEGDCVRAAQFVKSRRGVVHLHACADVRIPEFDDPYDRAAFLAALLERRDFRGSAVTLAAPPELLESDLLELPESRSGDTATEQTARQVLARASRCAEDEIELAAWERRSQRGNPTAFALGLRHSSAIELIEPLECAGLEVARIGCAASASAALLSRLARSPEECTALIRFGATMHLLLLCQGPAVIYQRVLHATGWKDTIDPACFAATIPGPEQLGELRKHLAAVSAEVMSTLDCVPRTFGHLDITALYVAGPFSSAPAVTSILEQSLQSVEVVPVESWPAVHPSVRPTAACDVAIGLAIEEVYA
jgi:hypothetical protein